jgi:hypothetical protein
VSQKPETPPFFPVLWQSLTLDEKALMQEIGCPKVVPWDFVEPHREQAKRNHAQTLERLAQRGGLSPSELVAVVTGEGLQSVIGSSDVERSRVLVELLRAHSQPGSEDLPSLEAAPQSAPPPQEGASDRTGGSTALRATHGALDVAGYRVQLVEVGGELDDEGMGIASFRAKPEVLRALASFMFRWVDLKIEEVSDGG